MKAKNAGRRLAGWCLLSSQTPSPDSSALFPPKYATNVLSDVRRTGRIVGGGVLMMFVILCSALQMHTAATKSSHTLSTCDTFIHLSAV